MSTVIKVENLSKKYLISHEEKEKYVALRDVITNSAKNIGNRLLHPFSDSNNKPKKEEFWALNDVSFEVRQGERIGIIGRNGAGKSTLLKLLSRITEPTEGRITLKGRVSSLLEVGTGFHPELTGRENIYLNGAILGMSRNEINRKFDEIVDFAEVDKFLDTPVKRYSSGMQVRLAFAVAAHLEPEILLVDEVLAVGDAAFQKKCLGKMEDVTQKGRTVIFVSHNMEAIRRLCPRALFLDSGKLYIEGKSEDIISEYIYGVNEQIAGEIVYEEKARPGDEFVRLSSVRFKKSSGVTDSFFSIDEDIHIKIEYLVLQEISNFHVYLRVYTDNNVLLFGSGDWDGKEMNEVSYSPGQYVASCVIPKNLLNRNTYFVTVMGQIPGLRYLFIEENILKFTILPAGGCGGTYSVERPGALRPLLKWTVKKQSI